jgi:hypothetical protein
MNDRLPSGPTRLFGAEARIVMPSLVEEFVRTIRQIAPCRRGDGIEHDTELSFQWVHLAETLLDDIALLTWRRECFATSENGGVNSASMVVTRKKPVASETTSTLNPYTRQATFQAFDEHSRARRSAVSRPTRAP